MDWVVLTQAGVLVISTGYLVWMALRARRHTAKPVAMVAISDVWGAWDKNRVHLPDGGLTEGSVRRIVKAFRDIENDAVHSGVGR